MRPRKAVTVPDWWDNCGLWWDNCGLWRLIKITILPKETGWCGTVDLISTAPHYRCWFNNSSYHLKEWGIYLTVRLISYLFLDFCGTTNKIMVYTYFIELKKNYRIYAYTRTACMCCLYAHCHICTLPSVYIWLLVVN